MVKRSTFTPSDEEGETKPPVSPSSTREEKPNLTPAPTPSPKKRKASQTKNDNGTWDPDKREQLIERVLAIGLKNASLEQLAIEFEVSKQQMSNALQAGRKGNLRDKACKAVRGDAQG
ncbi:hypothetical protein M231_06545 [Tremella mesenterica]|uniref:Uncharacterized protein n=1 Tax=Tremella mesenterica TaxID=5217 RepID=A0A4Q1BG69_TREME|nr:uncharacterized protein TREMEDRAFT_58815 [Tremella mesenterica DSM 1558]EIW72645.1 hypothetical protein TREMEDRAFT_58815 [Tremella mesenterica DSM 1558]RXK36201.1 hypothetical protein M231_06545 [Tremella mesenterica]